MSKRRRKEWKNESRYPGDGPDMPNPARGGIEAIHDAEPG